MRSRLILAATVLACVLAVVLGVVVADPPSMFDTSERGARRGKGRKAKAKGRGKAKAKAKAARRDAMRERREERRAQRQAKKEARAARRAELAEKRKARKDKEDLSPEEKALARAEARAEQIDELLLVHDEVAADLGMEPETADEVAILLMDTSDLIGAELERVDLGEVTWEEVRDEIAALRADQAAQAEALLGEQLFDEWTYAMGFRRFNDEEWTRDAPPPPE